MPVRRSVITALAESGLAMAGLGSGGAPAPASGTRPGRSTPLHAWNGTLVDPVDVPHPDGDDTHRIVAAAAGEGGALRNPRHDRR